MMHNGQDKLVVEHGVARSAAVKGTQFVEAVAVAGDDDGMGDDRVMTERNGTELPKRGSNGSSHAPTNQQILISRPEVDILVTSSATSIVQLREESATDMSMVRL